jgi:hypothetical protein
MVTWACASWQPAQLFMQALAELKAELTAMGGGT